MKLDLRCEKDGAILYRMMIGNVAGKGNRAVDYVLCSKCNAIYTLAIPPRMIFDPEAKQ